MRMDDFGDRQQRSSHRFESDMDWKHDKFVQEDTEAILEEKRKRREKMRGMMSNITVKREERDVDDTDRENKKKTNQEKHGHDEEESADSNKKTELAIEADEPKNKGEKDDKDSGKEDTDDESSKEDDNSDD